MPVWYVIEGYDGQDVLAQRLQARPEHLARLHALARRGDACCWPGRARRWTVKTRAGRFQRFGGDRAVRVAAAGQAWADADPYVAAGVYTRVQVRPFRKVLP
ncbi:hypothetical protein C7E13_03515 [Stenotrophomonas maltophilia]|nr:hypothetical protein C7E13_03515 [Stenotrophomonas maltophilia]